MFFLHIFSVWYINCFIYKFNSLMVPGPSCINFLQVTQEHNYIFSKINMLKLGKNDKKIRSRFFTHRIY